MHVNNMRRGGNNDNDSSMRHAACFGSCSSNSLVLSIVQFPGNTPHTHTGTHTDTNAGTHMWLAKSFLIKLNLMLPNAEALGLFGFILQQIALQTPLLLLLTTTSNQQRQRQGQGQKQRQRQRQSRSQGSYRVRAGQASVRVRASPTTNANELQNAMQCMHKK